MELKRSWENHEKYKPNRVNVFLLGLLFRYQVFRLNLKTFFINQTIKKINKANGVNMNFTVDRLKSIKQDIVNSLDGDERSSILITVPDISIRDYFLADPLFKNFYSHRVSFKEKKLKHNKLMLCLIERI